jgi:hypothetical protein
MAKILTLDEMLETLQELNHPLSAYFKTTLESVGTMMAFTLGKELNLNVSRANFEGTSFAGTCATFAPYHEDQPIPECLEYRDEDGDWEPRVVDDEYKIETA